MLFFYLRQIETM
jgi:hypothetical protein